MKKEPIHTEGRYAVFAEQDRYAEDPYNRDFMPPMMRYGGSSHYERIQRERDFDAGDIICLIKPENCDTRGKRERLLNLFDYGGSYIDSLREVINDRYKNSDGISSGFCDWIKDRDFEQPIGWRDCIDFFDRIEALCEIVGIACINEQTNGYSQGDSYLVFMAATPEWLKETGCDPSNIEALKENLMDSFGTWSAWCWGDTYGYVIKPIEVDEDGDVEYGECVESCCGYYGDDHKASGLLEAATSMIECLINRDNREAAASYEAACRDIVTA